MAKNKNVIEAPNYISIIYHCAIHILPTLKISKEYYTRWISIKNELKRKEKQGIV